MCQDEGGQIPIDSGFPIEFAFLVDLNNDGKANDVLPQWGDAGRERVEAHGRSRASLSARYRLVPTSLGLS